MSSISLSLPQILSALFPVGSVESSQPARNKKEILFVQGKNARNLNPDNEDLMVLRYDKKQLRIRDFMAGKCHVQFQRKTTLLNSKQEPVKVSPKHVMTIDENRAEIIVILPSKRPA
ncbi:MAG: hypothetical protein HQL32_07285 [Planctomycetes bacterium]|nr:hypothetical protein [Planctomycetota bacterium]